MGTIINAKDLRPGHTFLHKNNVYLVLENSFNKTAMREGIVKCKVKNLRTLTITTEVLTGEKLEQANILKSKCIFSYEDLGNFFFIDSVTFEQYEIPFNKLVWEKNFLIESLEVSIMKYKDEILGIQLPDNISIKVKEAEEAVKGNTVHTAQKKAWLETGYEITVPQFINSSDKIIISTITGNYVGRSKND